MEENLKEFIKKHGGPIDVSGEYALETTILNCIGEMVIELENNAPMLLPQFSKLRVMEGILIQVINRVSDAKGLRVPTIKVFMNTHWADKLLHGDNFGYGEMPMMNLFRFIMENEDETWITNTSVLNWNMQMGTLRNPTEMFAYMWPTLGPKTTVEEYFGLGDEMVTFLTVELNDYRG